MLKFLDELTSNVIKGKPVTFDQASRILEIKKQKDIVFLLSFANSIRNEFKGSTIDLCAIINAKSGRCSENCKFCSQSSHYKTTIDKYPLKGKDEIIKSAKKAASLGINRFSIVVSGRDVKDKKEWESICQTVSEMSSISNLNVCASLGTLTRNAARELKDAGLERYHHNLETAESYFSEICTTHAYQDRIDTVTAAKAEGLQVCSGGLFGLGETNKQIVELAFALKALDVDAIPLNFLNPIPNTPFENALPRLPMDIFKIIALFRFLNPTKSIRICGGRQINLRDTQALIFMAGADAVMTGDYLTTSGSDTKDDLQMIKDIMLEAGLQGEQI